MTKSSLGKCFRPGRPGTLATSRRPARRRSAWYRRPRRRHRPCRRSWPSSPEFPEALPGVSWDSDWRPVSDCCIAAGVAIGGSEEPSARGRRPENQLPQPAAEATIRCAEALLEQFPLRLGHEQLRKRGPASSLRGRPRPCVAPVMASGALHALSYSRARCAGWCLTTGLAPAFRRPIWNLNHPVALLYQRHLHAAPRPGPAGIAPQVLGNNVPEVQQLSQPASPADVKVGPGLGLGIDHIVLELEQERVAQQPGRHAKAVSGQFERPAPHRGQLSHRSFPAPRGPGTRNMDPRDSHGLLADAKPRWRWAFLVLGQAWLSRVQSVVDR